ncbi:hypothetical protein DM02DRAFT_473418, partial [Periconia macrospinosa]
YEYFDGRRYHTAYLRPNDEAETDVDDILHHVLRLLMDKDVYLSPVNGKATKILDIGTG